jgi:hypothetical protein
MEVLRNWISLAKSAMVGSTIGKEMEVADEDGEVGTMEGGVVVLECGGGVGADAERLGVGAQGSGPRLRSS